MSCALEYDMLDYLLHSPLFWSALALHALILSILMLATSLVTIHLSLLMAETGDFLRKRCWVCQTVSAENGGVVEKGYKDFETVSGNGGFAGKDRKGLESV